MLIILIIYISHNIIYKNLLFFNLFKRILCENFIIFAILEKISIRGGENNEL